MKLLDFIPIIRQIVKIIRENKKKQRRKKLLKTLINLLDMIMETTDWRDIVTRLWRLTNAGELPKTLRRPEDVKKWLFVIVALLEELTKRREAENATG